MSRRSKRELAPPPAPPQASSARSTPAPWWGCSTAAQRRLCRCPHRPVKPWPPLQSTWHFAKLSPKWSCFFPGTMATYEQRECCIGFEGVINIDGGDDVRTEKRLSWTQDEDVRLVLG